MFKAHFWVVFIGLLLHGSIIYSAEPDRLAEYRLLVRQFGGELKGQLLSALKEGGPVSAISVCSQKAPLIAGRIAQENDLEIGRTSLRPRNLSNVPDPWEKLTLEMFEEQRNQGADVTTLEAFEVFTEGEKQVFRYMKAIPVGEPCLTCHGKAISAELKEKLLVLYPQDQALGFSPGEILGAFSLTQVK